MLTKTRIFIVDGNLHVYRDIGGEFGSYIAPALVYGLTCAESGARVTGSFDGYAHVGTLDGRIVVRLNAESATGSVDYIRDEEPSSESTRDYLDAVDGASAAKKSKPRKPSNASATKLEAYRAVLALRGR